MALAGPGSAQARSASPPAVRMLRLSVRVKGLPGNSRRSARDIEAVAVNSGEVVASAELSRPRQSLSVPAGLYLIVARVADLRKSGESGLAISRPVQVSRGGKTVTLDLSSPGKPAGASASAVGARASAAAAGTIGVGKIPLSSPAGSGFAPSAQGGIITGLLPECQEASSKLLDRSKEVTEAQKREQKLSDEGRTETKVHYSPLEPALVIKGKVSAGADGRLSADLSVVDAASGEVVDHIVTAADPGSDLSDFLRRLGQGIGQRDCGEKPKPPAPTPVQPPTAAEGSLGPLRVSWQGEFSFEIDGPSTVSEHASWQAEGSSSAGGEAEVARVTAMSGETTNSAAPESCGRTTQWQFEPADTAAAWSLDLTEPFPLPGWKYKVPASPVSIPYHLHYTCEGNPVDLNDRQLAIYGLMLSEGLPPARAEELETQVQQPLLLTPGQALSETRTFAYTGPTTPCPPGCSTIVESMTLTIHAEPG
jgi:hypothetical protein